MHYLQKTRCVKNIYSFLEEVRLHFFFKYKCQFNMKKIPPSEHISNEIYEIHGYGYFQKARIS